MGIDIIDIEHPRARGRITTFGAQVLAWTPAKDGRERLWLSERAGTDGRRRIRGGVPVCWPWFGPHPDEPQAPTHGFASTRPWQLLARRDDANGANFSFRLPQEDGAVELALEVHFGDSLEMALTTHNGGRQPFTFTGALHTYFAVDDIAEVRLEGLHGDYLDKTRDYARAATPSPYAITAETDRIHLQPAARVDIVTPDWRQPVHSAGHDSIVVWNPWRDLSAALDDMDDDGYRNMICVETAITGRAGRPAATVAAGEQLRLLQRLD